MINDGEKIISKSSSSMYNNRALKRWKISFSNKFNFTVINGFEKIYIYSPSLRQDLYQKLIKCFSNYIPIHIITKRFFE